MSEVVKCRVCGKKFQILSSHVKVHGLTKGDYILKYPGAEIMSASHKKRLGRQAADQMKKPGSRAIVGRRTFDFVPNKELRNLLQRDYRSAKTCLKYKLWKSAIILYGSIIEAILREQTGEKTFSAAIEESRKARIISNNESYRIQMIRDLRNFVHLHKELDEEFKIDRNWAIAFSDMCISIVNRLKER